MAKIFYDFLEAVEKCLMIFLLVSDRVLKKLAVFFCLKMFGQLYTGGVFLVVPCFGLMIFMSDIFSSLCSWLFKMFGVFCSLEMTCI